MYFYIISIIKNNLFIIVSYLLSVIYYSQNDGPKSAQSSIAYNHTYHPIKISIELWCQHNASVIHLQWKAMDLFFIVYFSFSMACRTFAHHLLAMRFSLWLLGNRYFTRTFTDRTSCLQDMTYTSFGS
jgi:hypothetical protein